MKTLFSKILFFLLLTFLSQQSRAAQSGYQNGFFLANDANSFRLSINGFAHPRVQFSDSDINQGKLSFLMRSAGVYFGASIESMVRIGFALYHATNSQSFSQLNIASATASYLVSPNFNVRLGMVGLPLDIIGSQSGSSLISIDYPITMTHTDQANAFSATRASFGSPNGLGVRLLGEVNRFFYDLGVVNGSEDNYAPNPDLKFSAGARFGVNIFGSANSSMNDFAHSNSPQLQASLGAIFQGKRTDNNFATARDSELNLTSGTSVAPVIDDILTVSVGSGFRYKGMFVQGEGYFRSTKFASFGSVPAALASDNTLEDLGYYLSAGYFLIPKKLEVGGQAGQVFRQGPDNNVNSFGAAVNYYFLQNNLKLQFAYTWTEDYSDITGNTNNDQHQAALQLRAAF